MAYTLDVKRRPARLSASDRMEYRLIAGLAFVLLLPVVALGRAFGEERKTESILSEASSRASIAAGYAFMRGG